MSTSVMDRPAAPVRAAAGADAPVVALKRRTIDTLLIGCGIVAAVVFALAGALLTWGSGFAGDYVDDELTAQHIVFPSAEALQAEGRTDLLEHAGATLDTGEEAEAYASYIDGHLADVAGGATYAELGGPERSAKAAVEAARAEGASEATIAELQAEADAISGQRTTLFKGETLRGLLLTAYAWATVGSIAGIAGIVAFVAAGVMAVLVVLGMVHHRRTPRDRTVLQTA